jgi:predicted DNA binding CopG/RHH family protein
MKIVSSESGIRREVAFFSLYFASGRKDQRFALSPLERQPLKRRELMKKEYNLGKLRKRPGKAKIDPDAAKTPISIRLDGTVLADLRSQAERLGVPYQTLIGSILHRYVKGELVDPKAIDLGRIVAKAS